MDEKKKELHDRIMAAKNIVFLGGAGVSTASGIPDFRSPTGLYNIKNKYGVSYETMLSASYFYDHTEEFYEFYFDTMVSETAKPNKAHLALARFEEKYPHKSLTIITQNIDGLHQDAGSHIVLEAHGTTKKYHCLRCDKPYSLDEIPHKGIPFCKCGGLIKPDVVLYEEGLDANVIDLSIRALQKAEVLIIGGTSMNVYPVAGFPRFFNGDTQAIINLAPTFYDDQCDYVFHEDLGKALEEILLGEE